MKLPFFFFWWMQSHQSMRSLPDIIHVGKKPFSQAREKAVVSQDV